MIRAGAVLAASALVGAVGTGAALADGPVQRLELAGHEVAIAAPRGSCPLDANNPREAPLIEAMDKLQSARNKLLLRFVDCGELQQFRDNQREGFAHHGMILAVLQDGRVQPVAQASRRQFLDDVAKSLPTLDTDRLLAETRERLASVDGGPGIAAMQPLGVLDRNDDGLYVGFVVRGVNPGSATLAIMGLTLVNRIALTLYLYQPFDNPAALNPLLAAERSSLHDLLALNGDSGGESEAAGVLDWRQLAIAASIGGIIALIAMPILARRWRQASGGRRHHHRKRR